MFTIAFGGTIAACIAAWLGHLPSIDLSGATTGPLILAVWFVSMILLSKGLRSSWVWSVGPGAGFTSALILGLLLLGTFRSEQTPEGEVPAPGLQGAESNFLLYAAGFAALGTALGLIACLLGSRIPSRPPLWLSRFGLLTAVCFIPLLGVGGLVTSHDAGMAIDGWPGSDGANMFLYPISLMAEPGRYYEHTHRLLGSLAGLTTIAMVIATFSSRVPKRALIWSLLLLLFVIVQGVAGGLRVTEDNSYLGVVHGVFGQVVFAWACVLAALVSPAHRDERAPERAKSLRRLKLFSTGALHACVLQLTFGAVFRHLKFEGSPGATHALWAHVAFSFVVVVLAVLAGSMATGVRTPDVGSARAARRAGVLLLVTVGVQFIVGWAALVGVMPALAEQPEPMETWAVLTSTLHQLNGAFVLAGCALTAAWASRLWKLSGTNNT